MSPNNGSTSNNSAEEFGWLLGDSLFVFLGHIFSSSSCSLRSDLSIQFLTMQVDHLFPTTRFFKMCLLIKGLTSQGNFRGIWHHFWFYGWKYRVGIGCTERFALKSELPKRRLHRHVAPNPIAWQQKMPSQWWSSKYDHGLYWQEWLEATPPDDMLRALKEFDWSLGFLAEQLSTLGQWKGMTARILSPCSRVASPFCFGRSKGSDDGLPILQNQVLYFWGHEYDLTFSHKDHGLEYVPFLPEA